MTKQLRALLAAIVVAVLLPLTTAQPAHAADPFAGDCRREPRKKIIHTYQAAGHGHIHVRLRCGWHSNSTGKGMGYRHIKRKHGFLEATHDQHRGDADLPRLCGAG